MDIFQIVLFISIIIGILLVIKGMFLFTKYTNNYSNDNFETSNTIKFMESTLDEVDKTMEKFNEKSTQVFSEMDEKYEKLLFLYTLIDEKKPETIKNSDVNIDKKALKNNMAYKKPEKPIKTISTNEKPSSLKIIDMAKQGLSISEMAKNLNIGQGEVKLILELGKNR